MTGIQVETTDLGVRIANIASRNKDKIKHSGFLITINTNYNPKQNEGNATECAEKLRSAVYDLLHDTDKLEKIIKFLIPGHTFSREYIKKVQGEFVIERGRHSKGSRIHAHATLHIDHYSKIHLDIPKIKEVLLPYFADGCTCDIKNLYINVRAIRNDLGLRNYLRKEN